MQRFFRLVDDVSFPGRWHLATPTDTLGHKVDCWEFTRGSPVHVEGRLSVPIEHTGRSLDFSEAGQMVPIVHVRTASAFAERAPQDIQFIPVDVEGQPDQYLLLVAMRRFRCIDEEASKVRFWTPEHGVPDMVGQYIAVDHLRIDTAKVGDTQIFRPEGWEVALIVSEAIKDALERLETTGTKFEEV